MVQAQKYKKSKKPEKPYPDFPLFAHANGQWAKKIRRKLHYFGPWGDWRAALDAFLDKRDDLLAGRTHVTTPDAKRFDDLKSAFIESKQLLAEAGELSTRTPEDYRAIFDQVSEVWGNIGLESINETELQRLRTALARRHSPVTLANDIQRIRCLFNWAYNKRFIEQPMRYGDSFDKPSRKVQRKQRNDRPKKFFPAHQIRQMLEQAQPQLRAMILLGINCGFGNDDCATLTHSTMKDGWHEHPRPKTETQRRCPLWAETLGAIQTLPKTSELVFITRNGESYKSTRTSKPITSMMGKFLRKLGVKKAGVNFYALRHTFQTIGEEVDPVATGYIMGHLDESIATHYREYVRDHRLKAVTDHVYSWLGLTDGQATCPDQRD